MEYNAHSSLRLAPARRARFIKVISVLIVLCILGLGVGVSAAMYIGTQGARVPKAIAEKLLFPVYLPAKLPAGYSVASASFSRQDDVLLFSASNGSNRIVFSEQPKPKDFDFTGFYQKNLTDSKNLQGLPYTSIFGKTELGKTLLSVTADSTWLIITTDLQMSEDDLRLIAQNLQRQ